MAEIITLSDGTTVTIFGRANCALGVDHDDHAVLDPFEVTKHGSHDQSAHGNWARGGRSVSEDIAHRTQTGGGGSTTWVYADSGNKAATSGKVLSIDPDESRSYNSVLNKGALAAAVQDYRRDKAEILSRKDKALGTWVDKEAGVTVLDVVSIVETAEEADRLARQHDQVAYYDLDTNEEVFTDGSGGYRKQRSRRVRRWVNGRGSAGASEVRHEGVGSGSDSRGDSGGFDPFGFLKHGSHDQSSHGNWARARRIGSNVKGSGGKLTDEQYAARKAYIHEITGGGDRSKVHEWGIGGPNDTAKLHADENGDWTPERRAIHDEIIDATLAQAEARGVEKNREVILMGGLGGAGKSTLLRSGIGREFGVEMDGSGVRSHLVINPDDFKSALVARGLVPVIPGLTPMESSHLVHEESSYLAKSLAEEAGVRGMNVIWDFTMGSSGSGSSKLASLSTQGYDRTSAIFVDVSVEHSKASTDQRHRDGVDRYLAGTGDGGRVVPNMVLEAARMPEGSPYKTKNRLSYETLVQSGEIHRGIVVNNENYVSTIESRYNASEEG